MNGVLSETVAKAGRSLSQETIKNIEEFYNDMYSPIMSSPYRKISSEVSDEISGEISSYFWLQFLM